MHQVPLDGQPDTHIGFSGIVSPLVDKMANTKTNAANVNSFEKKSFLFGFFTLINEITKLRIWHISFYFLQFILPVLQFIGAHFWFSFVDLSDLGDSYKKFASVFNMFLSFSLDSKPGVIEISTIAVVFIVLYASSIALLIVLFNVKNTGHCKKLFAIISAVILQILFYAFTLPLGYLLGISLNGILESDGTSVASFFFALIMVIIIIYINNITTSTINYLSNPSQSIFTTFTGRHTMLFLTFNLFVAALGQVGQMFPSWYPVFAVIVSIALHAYLLFDIFSVPFATISGNVIAGAAYIFAILGDIMSALVAMKLTIPGAVYIIIPFAGFIIAAVALYFVFKKHINRAVEIVTLLENQNPIEVYDEMDLNSEKDGLYYERLGLLGGSISILNGAFPIYIAERYNTFNTWIMAAQILSLVPGEHDAFLKAHNTIKSMYTKSSVEKIKALSVLRIEQTRYASSDTQSTEAYTQMKNSTNDAIAAVRQFWADVSTNRQLTLLDVSGIGYLINQTNNQWKESLATYPNDPKFAELYSTYNIECTGKFEKGVYWLVKSSHLENGLHSGIDPLFRSFVISKPELMHRRIVDKYGNVAAVMDGDMTLSMTMSTATGNAEEKLEEEIDGGIIEKKSAELFLWPKLRLTVTSITSKYTPPYFMLWNIIRIVAVIAILVVLIIMINIFYVSFNTTDVNIHQSGRLINTIESLTYAFTSLLLRTAKKSGHGYTAAEYEEYLGTEATKEESYYAMHYDDPEVDKEQWTSYGVSAYLELFKAFADATENDVNVSKLIADLRDPSFNKSFCKGAYAQDNYTDGKLLISTKNAIISTLWNQFILEETELTDDNFPSSPVLCETDLVLRSLPDNIRTITEDLTEDARSSVETCTEKNKIILYIYIAVGFVIICFSISPIINLHISQNRIFKALTSINSAGALEGSHPIRVNSDAEKLHSNTQKQTSTYNSLKMIYTAMYIILFLASLIFPIVAYSSTNKEVSTVSDVIAFTHFGSERLGYIQHIFNLVTLQVLGVEVRSRTDYEDEVVDGTTTSTNHWKMAGIRAEFDRAVADLQESNRYFLYGDNNDGMLSRLDSIKDIHVKDNCDNTVTKTSHDFYSCLGIDRSISSFILYATQIMDTIDAGTAVALNSESYIDLHHFATTHIPKQLKESRSLTTDFITSKISKSKAMTVVYIVLAIVCGLLAELFITLLNMLQKKTIKALLILIRHLPPPIISESKEIIESLSLSETSNKEDDLDPLEVVFNGVSTPILCVGENNIIEATNKPLLETYNLTVNDVVGRHLNSVIQMPRPNEQEMTVEEQGASHLLEKMQLMTNDVEVQHCSYRVNFECNNDVPILVQMSAVPIKSDTGKVNFVVLVEDTRQLSAVQNELDILEKQAEVLLNQLIPRTIASFVAGRDRGFAFVAKTATIVAIRITGAFDMVQHSFDQLDEVFSQLDTIATHNPPFMPLKTIYDTLFYVGGLFTTNDHAAPAIAGIKFALEAKAHLEETLQKGEDRARFYISVLTGGPLLCGLVGSVQLSFEVTGPLIDSAATLLESAPPDMAIVAETTKADAVTGDASGINFDHQGTQALGMPTYLF